MKDIVNVTNKIISNEDLELITKNVCDNEVCKTLINLFIERLSVRELVILQGNLSYISICLSGFISGKMV